MFVGFVIVLIQSNYYFKKFDSDFESDPDEDPLVKSLRKKVSIYDILSVIFYFCQLCGIIPCDLLICSERAKEEGPRKKGV